MIMTCQMTFAATDPSNARVESVNKLLNTSSGAKQVLQSDNPEVKALHQKARDLHLEAKQYFDNGNNKEGSALLDQSAKTMFQAIRLATPKTVGLSKAKDDYIKHKKSVNALNSAYNRVADEAMGRHRQVVRCRHALDHSPCQVEA